ncbi:MAG: sigma-70 family RNA polymerase sigma factor [bacterium]|nr:sigma-70 family RNA polymerase sigma factor [bacterium]
MKDETAAIVARARAGEEGAFGLLVESHSRDVFRLAYRMTGNRENADDVVQEAFLRAFRSLHRFDERSRFGTWLHRITVNCAMDHLRRSNREASRRQPQADETILERQVSHEPGPERLAESGQIELQVERALGTLSPIERSAFVLRHFEHQSIAEIGHQLGARSSATKHAVFRAVRKLRRELAPWMETPDARTA